MTTYRPAYNPMFATAPRETHNALRLIPQDVNIWISFSPGVNNSSLLATWCCIAGANCIRCPRHRSIGDTPASIRNDAAPSIAHRIESNKVALQKLSGAKTYLKLNAQDLQNAPSVQS